MPLTMGDFLEVEQCPHCGVTKPTMKNQATFRTVDGNKFRARLWKAYSCGSCGGGVLAYAEGAAENLVMEVFPKPSEVDPSIPSPVSDYLSQAHRSVAQPAGAILLCASAVDAMLKLNQYEKGSLNDRIKTAVKDGLLTDEMGKWAHRVRLDANAQRHADSGTGLPGSKDAEATLRFADALAEYLFVIPAMISKGLEETEPKAS